MAATPDPAAIEARNKQREEIRAFNARLPEPQKVQKLALNISEAIDRAVEFETHYLGEISPAMVRKALGLALIAQAGSVAAARKILG